MERKRTWYAKYIGYCFTDDGKEVILEDVFYWEDENGKKIKEPDINFIILQLMKEFLQTCQK